MSMMIHCQRGDQERTRPVDMFEPWIQRAFQDKKLQVIVAVYAKGDIVTWRKVIDE